jgi:hypothetical protein
LAWEQWYHPASTRHPSLFRASPCEIDRHLVVVAAVVVADASGAGVVAVGSSFHSYLNVGRFRILLDDLNWAAPDDSVLVAAAAAVVVAVVETASAVAAARVVVDGPAAVVASVDVDAAASVDVAAAATVAAKTFRHAKGVVLDLDSFQEEVAALAAVATRSLT